MNLFFYLKKIDPLLCIIETSAVQSWLCVVYVEHIFTYLSLSIL